MICSLLDVYISHCLYTPAVKTNFDTKCFINLLLIDHWVMVVWGSLSLKVDLVVGCVMGKEPGISPEYD